jgi:hypothetical protein
MKGGMNPEDDGNAAQAHGSEKGDLVSKENLPPIRDLMLSIRKEKEHETTVQCVLVLRLQALLFPGSDASFGCSDFFCDPP